MKTNNAKHTPGPWAAQAEDRKGMFHVGKYIGAGRNVTVVSTDETLANARLIAAAPELLEALEQACAALHALNGPYDLQADIESVIAKATGGAE